MEETSDEPVVEKKKAKKIFSEEKQKLLREEKVNELRNKNHVNVSGHNVPALVETFQELVDEHDIPQQIVDNLHGCGYTTPTPVQMQAIPIMAKVRTKTHDLFQQKNNKHTNYSYRY